MNVAFKSRNEVSKRVNHFLNETSCNPVTLTLVQLDARTKLTVFNLGSNFAATQVLDLGARPSQCEVDVIRY